MEDALREHLGPCPPFFFPREKVEELKMRFHMDSLSLLRALKNIAQPFALASVSKFKVGAAALGSSGSIYLGANVEFEGACIAQTVHAEQCTIANAWLHREPALEMLVVTHAPCGHCRQFCNELKEAATLRVVIGDNKPVLLSALLPSSFGPADLNISGLDSSHCDTSLIALPSASAVSTPTVTASSDLVDLAVATAQRSHAPFGYPAGIALRLCDGSLYSGALLESVAFNPSFPPLQCALVSVFTAHAPWSAITEAVYAEMSDARLSYAAEAQELLRRIAPAATFTVVKTARRS